MRFRRQLATANKMIAASQKLIRAKDASASTEVGLAVAELALARQAVDSATPEDEFAALQYTLDLAR